MAQQIITYRANDGKLFDDEDEADLHNEYLAAQKKVEKFITETGLQKAQAGILRKYLPAYEVYIATGEVPDTVRPAPAAAPAPAEPAAEAPAAEAAAAEPSVEAATSGFED